MTSKKLGFTLLVLALVLDCVLVGTLVYVNYYFAAKVTEVIQLLSELGVRVNG